MATSDRGRSVWQLVPFEEDEHKNLFITTDNLVKFLRENKSEADKRKTIKKSNISGEIQNHIVEISADSEKISTTSFYRYIFHHYEDFRICKSLCDEIISQGSKNASKIESTKSVQELYRLIVDQALWLEHSDQISLYINEDDLKYVNISYKSNFEEAQWNLITIFELNFHFFSELSDRAKYEVIVEKKYKYFEMYKAMADYGNKTNAMALKVCQKNITRKAVSEALNGILLDTGVRHRPEILEKDIQDCLDEILKIPETQVMTVDCLKQCSHEKGVHVYLDWPLPSSEQMMIQNTVTLVSSLLLREHGIHTREIVFFKPGTMKEDLVGRFTFREKLLTKKLEDQFLLALQVDSSADDISENYNEDEQDLCKTCFMEYSSVIKEPLDINHFNVLKEWKTKLPLPLQLFFENSFINKASVRRRSGDIHNIYMPKITTLYRQFDSLLNTLSRTYSGITQDINTDELLVNYHNISTVFSITASVGISQSQKSGDRRLKLRASEDSCYFKTYLKPHPIIYQSVLETSSSMHYISLKGYYVILMMDNLVHLSMRSDPKPGESRSNQMCTLPITLKGIPKDSTDVQKWHGDGCDQSSNCKCLHTTAISQSDIQTVLFENLPEEEMVFTQFKKEATWSSASLWKDMSCFTDTVHLTNDDLDTSIDKLNLMNISQNGEEVNELDRTMESLHLHENLEYDIDDPNNDTDTTIDYLIEQDELIEEDESISISQDRSKSISQSLDFDITNIPHHDFSSAIHLDEPDSEDDEELERLLNEVDIEMETVSDLPEKGSTQFKQFRPPNMLCRHPKPASGRDDDKFVLKQVLDDILSKLEPDDNDRILFAPDYKIAKNMLQLKDETPKYQKFLADFPVLHLRKSKITNLISAYRSSGLIHILQYMKDEEQEKDWFKLLSIDNIETATRNIWRLSTALHTSFIVLFMKHLDDQDTKILYNDLCQNSIDILEERWKNKFEDFICNTSKTNATFCLHTEIMKHCDEIIAIALAERIGGPDGYNILLASVKSSLPFSFLNGASNYGIFCTRLLFEHYRSSTFYKNLKKALFSTPHNGSLVNFGLDTCREVDHRIAKKSIRPGSTLDSILTKMSTVDEQQAIHFLRKQLTTSEEMPEADSNEDVSKARESSERFLGKKITKTDKLHIYRTIKLILRYLGTAVQNEDVPRNIYHTLQPELPDSVLDRETYSIGQYLIRKHVANTKLFGEIDQPEISDVKGPKHLLNRIKKGQSVTINRSKVKAPASKTQFQRDEDIRTKKVVQLTKIVDCMSSKMNLCQAVVKPNCSKSTTNKSMGVRKALNSLLQTCLVAGAVFNQDSRNATNVLDVITETDTSCTLDDFMMVNFSSIPEKVASKTTISVIEFAGVKFKNFATTGQQYIQYLQNGVLKPTIRKLPKLRHIVICEEKYSFTPDDFKFLTRQNRSKQEKVSITHLKEDKEVVSEDRLSKAATVGTSTGKKLISSFLGKNIRDMDIREDIVIDIDSEANIHHCYCQNPTECQCRKYTTPIRAVFTKQNGLVRTENLNYIVQRKGEAEMSQVDWMKDILGELKEEDIILNLVTSADIDTLIIHLLQLAFIGQGEMITLLSMKSIYG